jgi:hypothetical protein
MAEKSNSKKQVQFAGGAPSEREVATFGAQAEKAKQAPYMILTPAFSDAANPAQNRKETRAMNAGKFPVRPFPSDAYDTTWSLKDDLSRPVIDENGVMIAGPMATPARPLPFSAEDVAYLKRKRDDEEMVGYEAWKELKYNLNDPATRAWYEKVCPSYFQQRESLLEQQIDLASRYAKIRLRGPKTEDDFKLNYFIETGRISLPKGPLWDPFEWISAEAGVRPGDNPAQRDQKILEYNRQGYRKGLFNPTKVMTPEKGGLYANPYNIADVAGYPESNFTGIIGAPISTKGNFAYAYGPTVADPSLFGARDAVSARPVPQSVLQRNTARLERAAKIPVRAGVNVFAPPVRYQPNPIGNTY